MDLMGRAITIRVIYRDDHFSSRDPQFKIFFWLSKHIYGLECIYNPKHRSYYQTPNSNRVKPHHICILYIVTNE